MFCFIIDSMTHHHHTALKQGDTNKWDRLKLETNALLLFPIPCKTPHIAPKNFPFFSFKLLMSTVYHVVCFILIHLICLFRSSFWFAWIRQHRFFHLFYSIFLCLSLFFWWWVIFLGIQFSINSRSVFVHFYLFFFLLKYF